MGSCAACKYLSIRGLCLHTNSRSDFSSLSANTSRVLCDSSLLKTVFFSLLFAPGFIGQKIMVICKRASDSCAIISYQLLYYQK
jgi:hypothetical protein